jgi:hypothetical protein
VIHALRVELRRLLPQLAGELVPAQPSVTALGVERGEVKNRQSRHARQGITVDRAGALRDELQSSRRLKNAA